MKINRKAVIGVVVVAVVGLASVLVVNTSSLWEMVLRMHGMR